MLRIIALVLLSFASINIRANEESSSENHPIFEYKGRDAEEIGEDISKMEITLSSEFEPLCVVEGCVNVANGEFFQMDRDFVGDTIDPLQLIRHYDDSRYHETFIGFKFGCQFPLMATTTQYSTKHSHALIEERGGCFIPYQGKSIKHSVNPRMFKKGYTNLCKGELSSKTNHINWSAIFHKGWKVFEGDNTSRTYNKKFKLSKANKKRLGVPTKDIYLLTEQTKPNGNRLTFEYEMNDGRPLLAKVSTINTQGQILNYIRFQYTDQNCILHSSCGKRVEYMRPSSSLKKLLGKVDSSQMGSTSYKYSLIYEPNVYQVDGADGRFTQVTFNKGKVNRLMQNSGTHYFTYLDQKTIVEDPLGHITSYQFDHNKRLQSISYSEKDRISRKEVFKWNESEGKQGWLKSKAIVLSDQCYQLMAFEYDHKGNVLKKTLYGNLTGTAAESFTNKDATEKYCTTYTYSNDNRNLKLSESTPNGWIKTYEYQPTTNLCTAEFQWYEGKIQERIFHTYDENGEIASQIEDDDSGKEADNLQDVTFRRTKQVLAVSTPGLASFGKPEKILEGYFHQNKHQILTKKLFSYDMQGRETAMQVYDSNDLLCYQTTKSYDSRGRVVLETNPLNEATRFAYNDSNKKIEEELIGSGKITHYAYNPSGWMASKTEKHATGESFITLFEYDAKGNLVKETNPYGHVTYFSYDRFGHQIKKYICSDASTYKKTFNILGQVISETDPVGYTTQYTYNLYGSKSSITYPDGSIERLVYQTNGWLKQHWKADGSSVLYERDSKGRIVAEITLSPDEQFLKKESYQYKGSHLIAKINAMGLETTYQYDGAGRKIVEAVGSKITSYSYDDFDRIATITHPEGAVEQFTYDHLGRITSKTDQDLSGKIYAKVVYTYDIHGNVVEKKHLQGEDSWSSYRSFYGSDSKLLWQEDPLGNRSTWKYNHSFINEKLHKVLACTSTDPLGRKTIEIFNIHGKLARKDILENDVLVSRVDITYDQNGNEMNKKASVYVDGLLTRDFGVTTHYNFRNMISTEMEKPSCKFTTYLYNNVGKLQKKIKPDGSAIQYEFDSLGRTIAIRSNDIHYTYTYDLNDKPVVAHDLIANTVQKANFDIAGRLINEELHPGVNVGYTYDNNDRITKLTLPDGSAIRYIYDPFNLIRIEKYTPQGILDYACNYTYDHRGNRLQDSTPAGNVCYTYDEFNRKIKINSLHWKSSLDEFDPLGNVLSLTVQDPAGVLKTHFAYDRFDHLIKDAKNNYSYDSLGNCVNKNEQSLVINNANQLTSDGTSSYAYDASGNLISHSTPEIIYTYDSLNRLKSAGDILFTYDAFGRCISIKDRAGERKLVYLGNQEMGSVVNGKLHELRVVNPKAALENTFAIEIDKNVFFPVQDERSNITALIDRKGVITQFSRFSPFGEETLLGDTSVANPWRFANKRNNCNLSIFDKRFYNPQIRRWQTPDPLGFEDGLNKYLYVRNNSFRYYDPDGRFVAVIPLGVIVFCEGLALIAPTLTTICCAVGAGALGWSVYKINEWSETRLLSEELDKEEEQKEEDKNKRGYAPDRELPLKPHGVHKPEAETAHTVLGVADGSKGKYRQAREFDDNGKAVRDIDFTDHGRPHDHTNPHQHRWVENSTGGSKTRQKAEPLPEWKY